MSQDHYPRDLIGYGRTPPNPRWPNGANVAVQFVINYEEGGENNVLHGDPASEAFLSEIVGAQPWPGQRHMNMESIYEFGSRAGFWRLWRLFTERSMPLTVFAVATAIAPRPSARSTSVWNLRSLLQCAQGIGVRPRAYSLTKLSMTAAWNWRSRLST